MLFQGGCDSRLARRRKTGKPDSASFLLAELAALLSSESRVPCDISCHFNCTVSASSKSQRVVYKMLNSMLIWKSSMLDRYLAPLDELAVTGLVRHPDAGNGTCAGPIRPPIRASIINRCFDVTTSIRTFVACAIDFSRINAPRLFCSLYRCAPSIELSYVMRFFGFWNRNGRVCFCEGTQTFRARKW